MDAALLIARLFLGLGLAVHGAQKMLAFTGYGAYSLDRFTALDWYASPKLSWEAVAAAVIIALVNVMLRRPPKPATP